MLTLPCPRHTVCPIKDVRVTVVPGPPEQLYPHDVKREIQHQVGKGNHEWLHPQAQFESHGDHTGGVVEARVCVLCGLEVGERGLIKNLEI